jgi:hypothetical protein
MPCTGSWVGYCTVFIVTIFVWTTGQEKTLAQKLQSMTWAQTLKRIFGIEIETCERCGSAVNVIASIEDPLVIQNILSRLNTKNDVLFYLYSISR